MSAPASPQPVLSYEQAPPISVPFRFLLTAPLFGVAAGLLLAWAGPEALASRWTPSALAFTHLLTVGFMLQAMCGALLQLIPVAAGGNVWQPRLMAGIVHPMLAAAAVTLVLAFLRFSAACFVAAGLLFLVALTLFLVIASIALLRTNARGPAMPALRLALLGLAITLVLGVLLAMGLGLRKNIPLIELANAHALWGLGGWAMTLLVGVSCFLVPMFQLTPPYPSRLAYAIPLLLLCAGVVGSFQLVQNANWAKSAGYAISIATSALFAASTIYLQQHRRRKRTDATFHFFRVSMISIFAILISQLGVWAYPEIGGHPRAPVWLGVLILMGVFVSAINGTLYKILPFLCWLHAQRKNVERGRVPNMKQVIAEDAIFRQMTLHFAAFGLLLISVLMPDFTRLAGWVLAGSFCLLEWNLIRGVRVYLAVPTSPDLRKSSPY